MSGRRSTAAFVRWIHTYTSLVAFAALFLFSATGLTLNHAAWFERAEPFVREETSVLPSELLAAGPNGEVDRLGIVEWLRKELGARGAVHELTVDDTELFVIFKGPAYTCDATIARSDGSVALVEERRGTLAWLDDLHKGRDTGRAWSLVIDVSAVVSAIAALTGLWLLLYVRKRLRPGLAAAAVGALALVVVAWLWLP